MLFLPVAANITLASLGELTPLGLIDARRGAAARPQSWVERLRIRTPGDRHALPQPLGRQPAEGRARQVAERAKSRILILDHPTRGLDVGAKEEVYELVRAVTAEGVGVILTSDTLEETIGLSHTVLVMRDGEITYRTDAAPAHKPRQVDLIGHMV